MGDTNSQVATESLPDYLTIPGKTIPSFHCRVGKKHDDRQPLPANTYGFPVPGVQSPSSTTVMARDYFVRYESYLILSRFPPEFYIVTKLGRIYLPMGIPTTSLLAQASLLSHLSRKPLNLTHAPRFFA